MTDSNDQPRFTADVMLGKLARHLIFAGFDCQYYQSIDDDSLTRRARDENRVLISRDQELINNHSPGAQSHLVESSELKTQIKNLFDQFNLTIDENEIFSRCPGCNSVLNDVNKEEVVDRIPRETRQWIDTYRICPSCDKLYWKGSHYEDIIEKFERWNLL